MKSFIEYIYEYEKRNIQLSISQTRIVRLCCHWNISVSDPIAELERVQKACSDSSLNPYYEAVHIHAYLLKLKAEGHDGRIWRYRPGTNVNFSTALLSWWRRTKRDEGMQLASRNPFFPQALAWFKSQEAKEQRTEQPPDSWEEVSKYPESIAFDEMSAARKQYTGPDLSERYNKLLSAIGHKTLSWPETLDRLITYYDLGRIPQDLIAFIPTQSHHLSTPIRILVENKQLSILMRQSVERSLRKNDPDWHESPQTTTKPEEQQPEEHQEEEFDATGLERVRVKLPGFRVPLFGWLMSSDEGKATIKLSAPVQIDGQSLSDVVTISVKQITILKQKKKKISASPVFQKQLEKILHEHSRNAPT